jgi:hypothetical protein
MLLEVAIARLKVEKRDLMLLTGGGVGISMSIISSTQLACQTPSSLPLLANVWTFSERTFPLLLRWRNHRL